MDHISHPPYQQLQSRTQSVIKRAYDTSDLVLWKAMIDENEGESKRSELRTTSGTNRDQECSTLSHISINFTVTRFSDTHFTV